MLDFDFRSAIEDKIQNDCEPFCEEINKAKQQLQNKIDELKGLAQSIFDETIKPINENVASHIETLNALQGFDTKDYESLLEGSNGFKRRLLSLSNKTETRVFELVKI